MNGLDPKYLIDISSYEVLENIGEGAYGMILKVKNKKTKKLFVAKISNPETTDMKMLNREIKLMHYLSHPTIIHFEGYSLKDFSGNDNIVILMAFAENGSLGATIRQAIAGKAPSDYNNTVHQIILIGVAKGLALCHESRIIHRDIKPDNILLDEHLYPKLADFGLSKYFDLNNSLQQSIQAGTPYYMAPEILKGDDYDRKADVYAYGILMYEVIFQECPYPKFRNLGFITTKFTKAILNNMRPQPLFPIKTSIQDLMERCWAEDPKDRPTFQEIYDLLTSGFLQDDEDDSYILDDVDKDAVLDYIDEINKDLEPCDVTLKDLFPPELGYEEEVLEKEETQPTDQKLHSFINSFNKWKLEQELKDRQLNGKINSITESQKIIQEISETINAFKTEVATFAKEFDVEEIKKRLQVLEINNKTIQIRMEEQRNELKTGIENTVKKIDNVHGPILMDVKVLNEEVKKLKELNRSSDISDSLEQLKTYTNTLRSKADDMETFAHDLRCIKYEVKKLKEFNISSRILDPLEQLKTDTNTLRSKVEDMETFAPEMQSLKYEVKKLKELNRSSDISDSLEQLKTYTNTLRSKADDMETFAHDLRCIKYEVKNSNLSLTPTRIKKNSKYSNSLLIPFAKLLFL